MTHEKALVELGVSQAVAVFEFEQGVSVVGMDLGLEVGVGESDDAVGDVLVDPVKDRLAQLRGEGVQR